MSKDTIFIQYRRDSSSAALHEDYAWRRSVPGLSDWNSESYNANGVTVTLCVGNDLEMATYISMCKNVTKIWWWDEKYKRARPLKIGRRESKSIVK